jgi:hypothetical protein
MSGSSVGSFFKKGYNKIKKTKIRKFNLEKYLALILIFILFVSFIRSSTAVVQNDGSQCTVKTGSAEDAHKSKSESLTNYTLLIITTIFAFLAYKYNKEKFRLELFEKRWEVYRNIAKFCSNAAIYGDLSPKPDNEDKEKVRKEAYDAMGKSFKGEGYHLRSLLFSNDMEDTFEELNQAYAFLSSHYLPSNQPFEGRDHLLKLSKIYEDLPNLFKPYLYFGDYRND